jgi:NitT/TauT family transport system substrate-binding protein
VSVKKFIPLLLLLTVSLRLPALDKFHLAIGYIPNIQFTPLYVGDFMGFFKEEGIELKIDYAMGADLYTLLLSGRADAALTDGDQFIIAAASGLPLTLFYQYYRSSPVAVVTVDPDIKTPADLAGKTIGTPELYGSSYIGLMLFLDAYGLTGSVKIERIGYAQVQLLQSGQIDAAVCFANNESVFLGEHVPGFRQWKIADIADIAGSGLAASSAHFNKNIDLYRRFSRALERSMRFVRQNALFSFRIFRQYVPTEKENTAFIYNMLVQTLPFYSLNGMISVNNYDFTQQTLLKLGLTARKIQIADYISNAS